MFSGIVEEPAEVLALERAADPVRLTVKSRLDHSGTRIGDSICISGVCLTVVECRAGRLTFEVSTETLRRSTLDALKEGARVNLERSVRYGDRLHGHLVSGHVDTTATLVSRVNEGNCDKLTFSIPSEYSIYLAEKGSISISGVSLTLGEISKDSFCVYIIPHTLKLTTLSDLKVGGVVNIEIDMLARYVYRILREGKETLSEQSKIDEAFLSEHGYIPGSGRKQ